MLICPVCGQQIAIDGPGIGSYRVDSTPSGSWSAYWIPLISNLRGSPTRLVHVTCYAAEYGQDALDAVLRSAGRSDV